MGEFGPARLLAPRNGPLPSLSFELPLLSGRLRLER
jgi:hypothetical protein